MLLEQVVQEVLALFHQVLDSLDLLVNLDPQVLLEQQVQVQLVEVLDSQV